MRQPTVGCAIFLLNLTSFRFDLARWRKWGALFCSLCLYCVSFALLNKTKQNKTKGKTVHKTNKTNNITLLLTYHFLSGNVGGEQRESCESLNFFQKTILLEGPR